jgi:hypothetical protein
MNVSRSERARDAERDQRDDQRHMDARNDSIERVVFFVAEEWHNGVCFLCYRKI